ncbi:hypothetical protein EYF80_011124 [Liparis tanakae]|uniref:Uncharacterized protein n=1 Tax=Liparis tanakae TaxID=230148 RepID=A0A4Z2IKZ9_9TELE|nr:hypothetical protein EYF80_011124 [Liparis tanakae]
MPEEGSDGDMHRLLWILRPHRRPLFWTAVSSGAFASLLPEDRLAGCKHSLLRNRIHREICSRR